MNSSRKHAIYRKFWFIWRWRFKGNISLQWVLFDAFSSECTRAKIWPGIDHSIPHKYCPGIDALSLHGQSLYQTYPADIVPVFIPVHPLYPIGALEFFLNGAELSLNSANSGNLINHWSTIWRSFLYMCLAGVLVASWSLAQEEAMWQVRDLLL